MSPSYVVEHERASSLLRGVLRLESVDAYLLVFGPAHEALRQGGYTLDVRHVSLMNSSGIRALANLVLHAKQHASSLVIVGSEAVAWQKKTLVSLGSLYDGAEIRLA